MPRSIYTLKKLINEFKLLIGCEIVDCFSQEKDSINLLFFDGEDEYYLEYSADNKFGGIYVKADFKRANKNTISLFDELKGEILQNVELFNNDRIIKFHFINTNVYSIMFSGGNANLIVTDKNNFVINSLNNKNELKEKNINDILTNNIPPENKIENIIDFISYAPFWLPKIYRNDFINKNNELSLSNTDQLSQALNNYIKNLITSKENYLYRKDRKLIISFIPLDNAEPVYQSETISKVVQKFISYSKGEDSYKAEYKLLEREISKKFKQSKSKYEIYKNYKGSEKRSEKYKLYGELLLSQINLKDKNGKQVKLNDWESNEITIKLDEKKSLLENGNIYFKKSKSASKEAIIRKQLLPEAKKQFIHYNSLYEKLKLCTNYKELKSFKNDYYQTSNITKEQKGINKKSRKGYNMSNETRFKEFDLGEGYILYVGKNAANNDELTLRFAKPNDYWFHARGSSGSHCVLKPIGKEIPPKYILTKAAEVAAYYSKSRNAKYTPVAYTQKKYVRKPKGANVGAVTISKEKVIMVEPKLSLDN